MEKKDYLSSDRFLLNRTHDILDSKWKLFLVFAIGRETYRFGELKRLFRHVSRLTLTRYLQELERDGFLIRRAYPAPPLRTEYSLTELGLSVYPLVEQLMDWGER